jgi:hypothetical protein
VSTGPYAAFNLAVHVGDDPGRVAANRARLRARLGLPGEPAWLTQVHGTGVADAARAGAAPRADAAFAARPGPVCAVLTADCLPVVLARRDGGRVGVAHAGWRGLAAGVIEAAVAAVSADGGEVLAWIGPGIGPNAYEVGAEVRDAFVGADPGAEEAFRPGAPGRWHADMVRLARRRLAAVGVTRVYGGGWCTLADPERFFSYRREPVTGRMATLVWIAPPTGP